MPAMTKCDQCNKIESDDVIARAETPHWICVDEIHPGPHDDRAECAQFSHYFCSWDCASTFTVSKALSDPQA